jgi:uncharacterized protein with NRDE domain
MCLILIAHKVHPAYPLVLAANRDEAYARATALAAFWPDHPRILGGRDLEQGGTWLGITRDGALAAVTNYRESGAVKSSTRSRGELAANYLRGQAAPAAYMNRLQSDVQAYNGFNLIAGNIHELWYGSNRGAQATIVRPGVHGLSNHLLDTPWPKVERGRKVMTELIQHKSQALIDGLFGLLAERTCARDDELPQTGVGQARERVLSPAFIVSPRYGTRSSTVMLVDNHSEVCFIERTFGEHGMPGETTRVQFTLESSPVPAGA